jgi:hypothetical protein
MNIMNPEVGRNYFTDFIPLYFQNKKQEYQDFSLFLIHFEDIFHITSSQGRVPALYLQK